MFLFCAVCAVAIPATPRFVPCVVFDALLVEFASCVWAAMVSRHREESPGCRERPRLRRFWKMPLRLMAGKNGYVSSVLKQTCGSGGVPDGVSQTFLQVCKGSARKPSLRKTKSGVQGLHRRGGGERKVAQWSR